MVTGIYNIIRKVTLLLAVTLLCAFKAQAQVEVEYGFTQNPADPLLITANAYPNFTSNNVTVSTATFTFLVPAGTIIQPTGTAPTTGVPGAFINRNGVWRADVVTTAAWGALTVGNPADLEGYDLYQMTLSPGSIETPTVAGDVFVAGQPFALFEFRLPNDCSVQDVRILENDESIQSILFNVASFNSNNQFSASVDDVASTDKYAGRLDNAHTLECSLVDLTMTKTDTQINDGGDGVVDAGVDTIDYTIVVTNTGGGSTGNIVVTDPLPNTTVVCGNDGPGDTDNTITTVLAPGDTATCTASHVISQDEINALTVTNQATASVLNPDTSVNTDPFLTTELSDDPDEPADVEGETPSDGGVVTGGSSSNEPDDPTVVTLPASAEIQITKSVETPASTLNGVVTFGFVVTNTGNIALTGVTIADTLIAYDGSTRALSGPAIFVSSTAGSSVGSLKVGESANYTGTYTLTQDDIDAGGLENNAQVTALPPSGPAVTDESDTSTDPTGTPIPGVIDTTNSPECFGDSTVKDPTNDPTNDPTCMAIVAAPSIEAVKTLTQSASAVGGTVTYDLVVMNTGNVTLSDVSLTETLRNYSNTILTAPTPAFVSATSGSSAGQLLVGESATYNVTYSLTQADIDSGGLDNRFVVNADPPSGPAVSDDSDTSTLGNGNPITTPLATTDSPDCYAGAPAATSSSDATCMDINSTPSIMAIKSIVTAGSAAGDVVEYEVVVTNTGNVTLTSVSVADTLINYSGAALSPSTSFILGSATLGSAAGTLVIDESATYRVTYALTQQDVASGGLENNALASGTPPVGSVVTDESDAGTDQSGGTIGVPESVDSPECSGPAVAPADNDPTCMVLNSTIAIDDINVTLQNTAVSGSLLVNDIDPQSDTQIVSGFQVPGAAAGTYSLDTALNVSGIDTTGANVPFVGTLIYVSATNQYDFVPEPSFAGTVTIPYEACDRSTATPERACDTAVLTITVVPLPDLSENNPPVAIPDAVETEVDTSVVIVVTANDLDPDGNLVPSTVNTTCSTGVPVCSSPTNGSVTNNGDGTFTYQPNLGFTGVDMFVYEVCDDGLPTDPVTPLCDTTTVTITVTPDLGNVTNAADDANSTSQSQQVITDVLENDTDAEDDDQAFNGLIDPVTGAQLTPLAVVTLPGVGSFTPQADGAGVPTGEVLFVPEGDYTGPANVSYQVCDDGTPVACDEATLYITVLPASVLLNAKVLLQGALNVLPDTYFFTTIMRDDLRIRDQAAGATIDFLPNQEPYAALLEYTHVGGGGGETVAAPASVFADKGNDSIVDWVFLELRSATDPKVVVATRSGLVQRDGDVVDMDGASPLKFAQSNPGSYYVSVNHRNHIGVMTAAAIPLSASGTTVDFTDRTIDLWHDTIGFSFDGFEQFGIDTDLVDSQGNFGPATSLAATEVLALWGGNSGFVATINADQGVIFAGQNDDVTPIFNAVDSDLENFFKFSTFVHEAYAPTDVNLNGSTVFAGQNNDVDLIFNNADQHPRNFFGNPSFVNVEQLAK